ncbi:MAG TPA: thiamine pyrophosphate-dependent dehydrogenase E1 component subunit alpha [Polyangiaceae bacterium]|nr:thiamine pyrophosphate-dependent dehydrogenase E1 component subunit alpha [Polyangiaceae bacterium]
MSTPAPASPVSAAAQLSKERLLEIHDLMLECRVLEERLIRMQRQGEGYFWIGGPGEEAFNTCLGLLMKKGQGLDHDFLHGHYRSSATLRALGAPSIDALRQMHNTKTDPYSEGRNFVGHFSKREWNVVPISSPIEVQFSVAIGTARAQKRHGGTGITIVQGGDAGTAEGDFATCLIWSSRPDEELPILLIVANNSWGISTAGKTQHGEQNISDRAAPFGIRNAVCDGNDPEAAWFAIRDAMDYVRSERKPFVLQANVSRLYGHSSSSGSNYVDDEVDCMEVVGRALDRRGWRSLEETKAKRDALELDMRGWYEQVLSEPKPVASDALDYVFADKNYVAGEV